MSVDHSNKNRYEPFIQNQNPNPNPRGLIVNKNYNPSEMPKPLTIHTQINDDHNLSFIIIYNLNVCLSIKKPMTNHLGFGITID